MKYSLEIEIDLPRDKVVELFNDPENLKKWQEGLKSFEHLEGEPGQPGAKSQLIYEMGKRRVEMTETITVRNLPDEFSGIYETAGIWNEVKNYFHEIGPNKTKWVTENEFKCSRFIMRIAVSLMPGAFRKQSMKYLTNFKTYAESTVEN